jgi:penicillin-insensitive murein endopeptidase
VKKAALAAGLFALAGCQTAPKNPWPEVKEPYSDSRGAHSIGGYSAGCLLGGVSLPPDGKGYQLMRLSRRRFYGHPELIRFLTELGERVSRAKFGPLLVGDLGQARGGPTNSNHRSHQTGLDVDIWFMRHPDGGKTSLTLDDRETLSAPSFVVSSGEDVDPAKWGDRETALLKLATTDHGVERIFVNAAIKRHLCRTLPKKELAWLRKLRPWFGHDDHFHVRLKCPAGDSDCLTQETIPEGPGCDTTLDWWFSDEAKKKALENEAVGIPPMPKLPDACAAVLSAGSVKAPGSQ